MQYDKNEFKYYYNNYIDIKNRIEDGKKKISELLENDFNKIYYDNYFTRYMLNLKMIEELEKGLENLYQDFIKSKAFPFSEDNIHFFVNNDTYLVDAINDLDSKDLSEEEVAKKGIDELSNFIKEIGLPTTLKELEISDKEMLRKVADSSNITKGCAKQLTHDEIYEILLECL